MHIASRPAIERPEGLLDEIDITTKPSQIKVGKTTPGHTLSATDSDGANITLSRGSD